MDDTRDILLWTDPDLYEVGWWDITNRSLGNKTSGTVYNFKENFLYEIYRTGENFLKTEEYERPVGIVLDKGMQNPRWANYLDCFGNGRCTGLEGNWKCECFPGYYGDCSMRTCPTGPAWFSEPRVADISHDVEMECSNAGNCDRATGQCVCSEGYEGSACERSTCSLSSGCGGNGRLVNNFGSLMSTNQLLTIYYSWQMFVDERTCCEETHQYRRRKSNYLREQKSPARNMGRYYEIWLLC